jgi:hypothetical protein
VDLSRSGETQIWIFGSWECAEQKPNLATNQQSPNPREIEARKWLLQSLFKLVYTRCVPLMPLTAPTSFSCVTKLRCNHQPFSPSAVLIGSCHQSIRFLIPDPAVSREPPCLKYIFPFESFEHTASSQNLDRQDTLPPGYRCSALRQPQDLQRAPDRTHIPRTVETLSLLQSRAIFHEGEPDPIAWGFVGIDASLTTLHTEQEHREKNLAVLLTRELLRMQAQQFNKPVFVGGVDLRVDGGPNWANADVEKDNVRSRRVMEKAGGRLMWKDCWVELELETLLGETGLWSRA